MKDIYGNTMIETLQINRKYTGIVMDNSSWDTDSTVKVWIKELFPLCYEDSNDVQYMSSKEQIYNNGRYIEINTDVLIIAKQIAINNILTKPNIEDKVTIEFIDGDIKQCVFSMENYLGEYNVDTIKIKNEKGIYRYEYPNNFVIEINTNTGEITKYKNGEVI